MATGTQGHRDQVLDKAKLAVPLGRRKRVEGKLKKNFPCQECQKVCNSLEKLKVHSYSHTGERPYRCSHPECTKVFVSTRKLLRHMATHSPEKNYKCSCCEKRFHRKDHLKNHLETHDPHKEAFTCQECGKSCNTKLGFKCHLALHAANSGDFTCQVCLKPFPSTGVLLEHLKTHAGKSSGGTKEKKYHCEHCEWRFYARKDVRQHMIVHTGRKDFRCQYCARRFGRKDHLTRHMKKSHPRELLGVQTESGDSLEPVVYDLASGSVKGELPGMLTPRLHQLNVYTGPILDTESFSSPTHPFSLEYPLGSNFTSYAVSSQELESSMPSSASEAQEAQLFSSKLELVPEVGVLEEANEEMSLSKMSISVAAPEGDSLDLSSSQMDFSQLFNLLELNGPRCSQVGGSGGEGVTFLPNEEPASLVQLPCQAATGSEAVESPFQGLSSCSIFNLSTPTTLPRFHQAFQRPRCIRLMPLTNTDTHEELHV